MGDAKLWSSEKGKGGLAPSFFATEGDNPPHFSAGACYNLTLLNGELKCKSIQNGTYLDIKFSTFPAAWVGTSDRTKSGKFRITPLVRRSTDLAFSVQFSYHCQY